MSRPENREDLDRECEVLCRYLVGRAPGGAVLRHYRRAHERRVVTPPGGPSPRDRRLVAAARRGAWLARTADVHARFFAPGGWLRRKLILLVALLETDPEGRRWVDEVKEPSTPVWLLKMTWAGAGFVVHLALGMLLFGWSSHRPVEDR